MKWITTQGRLLYDPVRRDLKKVHKERTLIVQLPRDDLDLYYQWFIRQRTGTWFNHEAKQQLIFNETQTALVTRDVGHARVHRPLWGTHVTVVRGDELGYKSANWQKYHGQLITIQYSPDMNKIWKFWSLPVKPSNLLLDLRAELGIKAHHDFHITIAREM